MNKETTRRQIIPITFSFCGHILIKQKNLKGHEFITSYS